MKNKSIFSQIRQRLSESHWDLLSVITVSLLALIINLSADNISPFIIKLWEQIRGSFYSQPSVAISAAIALVSIVISFATAILQFRRIKLLQSATEEAIVEKGEYSLTPAGPPLRVFVSSTMSDLVEERQAVAEALRQLPFTKPWLFESYAADAQPAQERISTVIKEADIFLLIIGERYSELVEEEYHVAAEMNKPILVFVKKGKIDNRNKASVFLDRIPIKWQEFTSTAELRDLVQIAIVTLLISSYRQSSVQKSIN